MRSPQHITHWAIDHMMIFGLAEIKKKKSLTQKWVCSTLFNLIWTNTNPCIEILDIFKLKSRNYLFRFDHEKHYTFYGQNGSPAPWRILCFLIVPIPFVSSLLLIPFLFLLIEWPTILHLMIKKLSIYLFTNKK